MKQLPDQILEAATNRLSELLSEESASVPSSEIVSWEVVPDYANHGAQISIDGSAEFIEFGTGVVGERNHAGINEEWLDKLPPPYNQGYNTGPSIIHVTQGDDYWAYKKDGKWIKTSGIAANPFIYRAVTRLQEEYVSLAREVAKQNGLG